MDRKLSPYRHRNLPGRRRKNVLLLFEKGAPTQKVWYPDGGEEIVHRSPQEIMDQIAALDAESAEVLAKIQELL